jgi:hypothetical protein
MEPEKRLQWHADAVAETNDANADGRLGVGAVGHCDHGGSGAALHRLVDWRPFSYFTAELISTKGSLIGALFGIHTNEITCLEMTELVPDADGWTTIHSRLRLMDHGWLARLRLRLYAPLLRRLHTTNVRRLTALLEGQYPDPQAAKGASSHG